MKVLDRSAVIIRPKQPYVDWANSTGPYNESLDDLSKQGRVVLVPEASSREEALARIAVLAEELFRMELEAWQPGKAGWPRRLDFETFSEWFEIEVQLMVIDSSDQPIQTEPFQ